MTSKRRFVALASVGAALAALLPISTFEVAHAATRTWTGLGGDALWSNAANWNGGVPLAGDDLVFPAGPTNKFNSNDFAAGTAFGSITVQDGGYTMGGNTIETDQISVTAGPTTTAVNLAWASLAVPTGGSTTVDVGTGAEVQMAIQVSLNADSIVYDVDGRLTISHNYTASAGADVTRTGSGVLLLTSGGGATEVPWAVQSGTTYFNSLNDQPALITLTGGVFGGQFGQTHGLNIVGGVLSPGNESQEAGFLQVSGGAIDIGVGGTFDVDINGVNDFDRLTTANSTTVALAGTLTIDAAGFVPTDGMSFMLINNDGVDAVTGTFAGLPDGAPVAINGKNFMIDYQGGDGNDVTLTSGSATKWDGGATGSPDNNWTTAANWVGDVAPVAGDSLEFSNNTVDFNVDQANVNDFPAGTTFDDILFGFAYYDLTGNPIQLTGNVVGNNGANANTISLDVTYVGGGSISVPTGGAQIILAGNSNAGGGTLELTGGGSFTISGGITNGAVTFSGGQGGFLDLSGSSKAFAGPLTIDGKYAQVNTTLTNAQVVLHGQQSPFPAGYLAGTGSVHGIDADGGTVVPAGQSTSGTLTSTANVTMDGTSVFGVDVDGTNPGVNHDQLVVTGTVTLGGGLSITSATPPLSGEVVLISNDAGDAVSGTFSGLAEGAIVFANGIPMTLSYAGGDGNDVSLEVLNAKVWDGGGGNANWTTAANWNNDTAPAGGETLIFPDSASQKTNVNNFPAGTNFQDLIFTGENYSISGNSIDLGGGISGHNQQGTNTLNTPLVLNADSEFFQDQGFSNSSYLNLGGQVTIGAGRVLTLTGLGTHTVTGNLVDGALTVDKREGITNGFASLPAMPQLDGPLTVDGGFVQISGDTPAATIVNSDGSLAGEGHVGTLTSTTGGGVSAGFGGNRGIVTADGDAAFGAGSFTSVTIDGTAPGTSHDQFAVNGTVTLGGGFFFASTNVIPPLSTEIVVIANDGNDAVIGTFSSLPEGGSTLVGGTYPATISYTGGDGNDVTLFLPPTFRWDGGGVNDDWTTAVNWQTDVAPGGNAGETLIFPNGASQLTAQNTLAAGSTFSDIRFESASGYTLTGNALELGTGITATNGTGTNTYSIPTTFTGNDGVFSQTAGGTFVVDGAVDLNGGSLTLTGAGDFDDLDGVADGDLVVATSASGTVTIPGTMPGLNGSVIVDSGTLVLDGNLAQADLVVNGGTVYGTGSAAGVTLTAGTLSPGASPGIFTSAGDFTLAAGATYSVELNNTTPGSGHDQVVVTGAVTLAGSLSATALSPANGAQFRIIDNDGSDPVSGAFAGLAEGAALTIDGAPFTITYQGGTGNDVMLIAGPQVELSTSGTTIAEGNPPATTDAGIDVLLSAVQGSDVVVHVQVTGGTATAGVDTSALDTDLTITAGSGSVHVPLSVIGDLDLESDETAVITLSLVTGGVTLGSPSTATVTITNDDSEATTTTAATTTTTPTGETTTTVSGGGASTTTTVGGGAPTTPVPPIGGLPATGGNQSTALVTALVALGLGVTLTGFARRRPRANQR